jgi:hypothetical protein
MGWVVYGTKIVEIVLVMLSPTLAVGAALHGPRAARALLRLVRRPVDPFPRPAGRPIEQIAADLSRLLRQHDAPPAVGLLTADGRP